MVCPPILMVCSVTEDSSLAVAGSHFSAGLASGAFASRSGACAARRAACPSKTKIPAAHTEKLFFIRLLPLISSTGLRPTKRRDCMLGRGRESKEALSGSERQSAPPPPTFLQVRIIKELREGGLGSADCKGLRGALRQA